jgi:hypothetical protein
MSTSSPARKRGSTTLRPDTGPLHRQLDEFHQLDIEDRGDHHRDNHGEQHLHEHVPQILQMIEERLLFRVEPIIRALGPPLPRFFAQVEHLLEEALDEHDGKRWVEK